MAGSVVRVVGSPERLADEVVERVRGEIEEKVKAALQAAREILEKAYEENLSRLEQELRHAAREARERVESYTARREVELRKKLSTIRAAAVEEALQEALQRLRETVGREEYEAFLARLIEDAASKIGSGTVTLHPAAPDAEAVRRAASKAKLPGGVRVEVSGDTVEGLGGFVARGGGVSLDYRLEVILSDAIEKARARIIETLFK